MPTTTPDPTAAQSDWVTTFRSACGGMLQLLSQLQYLTTKATLLGTPDNFAAGAFAGNNSDLAATQLDAAITQLTALQTQFYSSTGVPTALTTALQTVASVTLK